MDNVFSWRSFGCSNIRVDWGAFSWLITSPEGRKMDRFWTIDTTHTRIPPVQHFVRFKLFSIVKRSLQRCDQSWGVHYQKGGRVNMKASRRMNAGVAAVWARSKVHVSSARWARQTDPSWATISCTASPARSPSSKTFHSSWAVQLVIRLELGRICRCCVWQPYQVFVPTIVGPFHQVTVP